MKYFILLTAVIFLACILGFIKKTDVFSFMGYDFTTVI